MFLYHFIGVVIMNVYEVTWEQRWLRVELCKLRSSLSSSPQKSATKICIFCKFPFVVLNFVFWVFAIVLAFFGKQKCMLAVSNLKSGGGASAVCNPTKVTSNSIFTNCKLTFLFISFQPVNHCKGDRVINRCLWDGNYSSWILHQLNFFQTLPIEIHYCLLLL